MTNAEKYEAVFGMKLEFNACPCIECSTCKVCNTGGCSDEKRVKWWNSEYKESEEENE